MFVGCKAFDALMNANIKLLPNQGEILDDPSRYRRLVGKLNYLAVTRSDIAFIISVVSQFLSASRITDWNVVVWILMYLKKAPIKASVFELWTHQSGFSDANWVSSPIDRRAIMFSLDQRLVN